MSTQSQIVITKEDAAILKLRAIAKIIRELEGLPVDFRLASSLSAILNEIERKYGY